MNYLRNAPSRRVTPQNQPLPGQDPNSAGGHAWTVDAITRLRRFLILGAEGGTYYIKQPDLVRENVTALAECDPFEAIVEIIKISSEGRAPKNDPAIFALAFYAGYGHPNPSAEDIKVRQAALGALSLVCRTGTHLFHFLGYVQNQRGWGRSLRRAVGKWFTDHPVEAVAYQTVKYRQRDGWSQPDALRLSHPAAEVSSGNPTLPVSEEMAALFNWVTTYMHHKNPRRKKKATVELPLVVRGFVRAQKADAAEDTARLVRKYNLPREALLPEHLTDVRVWEALLYGGEDSHGMPIGALLRNLPTMTRVGLLKPMGHHTKHVVALLKDEELLKKGRIHPLQMLVAHLTYGSGQSVRGDSSWSPIVEIVDALDSGFYKTFKNVEPTGKRHLLALDVSASMDSGMVNGVPYLTPRVASSAMAMVTAATGDPYAIVGFTSGREYGFGGGVALTPLTFSPNQRLVDICRYTNGMPFGGTDCALPMLYAIQESLQVDCFSIYTDSETWAGNIHPSQALQKYREESGINARLVVVGMTSNGFSIADPNDPGMLDVVGFDTAAPAVMADFAAGKI